MDQDSLFSRLHDTTKQYSVLQCSAVQCSVQPGTGQGGCSILGRVKASDELEVRYWLNSADKNLQDVRENINGSVGLRRDTDLGKANLNLPSI